MPELREEIETLFSQSPAEYTGDPVDVFRRFMLALNRGEIRAAEPDPSSPFGWRVNAWVKQGILLGFRMGKIVDMSAGGLPFRDKDTYPLRRLGDGVRVVPGGSSIRDGVFLGKGVTCMPPMYINAGAWVDDGTLVDSHALVGSCAQVGKRVHLSAAAQLGVNAVEGSRGFVFNGDPSSIVQFYEIGTSLTGMTPYRWMDDESTRSELT